ncbi:TRAP transporter large permease subunit [Chloroflexota bacterium]
MEWWLILLTIVGSLLVLMFLGLPVAFCFILINIIGVSIFWGTDIGLRQLVISMFQSVIRFNLLPIPLFVLMGELLFQSRLAPLMLDALDSWLGRLPGRLGLLAIAGGTLFGALCGQSMATNAMLGEVLVPEMENRGYKKPMSLGPILGSGGLATMIPPSTLAVFLASLTGTSVGGLLLAGIAPGLVMAALYAAYTIIRCYLQPSLAPSYEVILPPLSTKVSLTAKNVLPVAIIILAVTGVIFLGVATPTEAAATGCLATFILVAAYGRLNWQVLKPCCFGTVTVTGMLLFIMAGSVAFSQIIAYSGASRELAQFAVNFPLPTIGLVAIMIVLLIILGMFMGVVSMVMITMPIFVPVVQSLGIDVLWFSVLVLLTMEMGSTSPPFGLSLFVMKGVAPRDTTMGDVYRAALPYLFCDAIVMVLMIVFPILPLWIPSMMR